MSKYSWLFYFLTGGLIMSLNNFFNRNRKPMSKKQRKQRQKNLRQDVLDIEQLMCFMVLDPLIVLSFFACIALMGNAVVNGVESDFPLAFPYLVAFLFLFYNWVEYHEDILKARQTPKDKYLIGFVTYFFSVIKDVLSLVKDLGSGKNEPKKRNHRSKKKRR